MILSLWRITMAVATAMILIAMCTGKDLYSILGVKKSASQSEIRKAYRNKAKETHPDKHISSDDKMKATIEFREVVEAYEILSDEASRKEYDRSGKTSKDQRQNSGRDSQQQQWQWDWDFSSFFHQGRSNRHQHHHQQQQRQKHRYFYDPYIRPQILDAQSRVITIKSKRHLKSIIYTELDDTDPSEGEGKEVIDRYTLIAFYNSSILNCLETLNDQLLYPWPFAGYSGILADKSDGMWWEETMIVAVVDVQANAGSRELAKYFGIHEMRDLTQCPSVGFIPRGGSIDDRYPAEHFKTHDPYSSYVWSKLKMNVRFKNKTPWKLTQYWLDGMRGKLLESIEPEQSFFHNTFVSHTFFLRADFVTGYTLTNESALLWYVSKIQDDGKEIEIYPRCFDHSGECARWRQEGFCSRTSHTFYTRQNPDFVNWVIDNCYISCKTGCGAESTTREEL
jgi:curved DNA-binding protein CbpA